MMRIGGVPLNREQAVSNEEQVVSVLATCWNLYSKEMCEYNVLDIRTGHHCPATVLCQNQRL